MIDTINFDYEFIADEELRLLETKQAILKKSRLRFGKLDEKKELAIIAGESFGDSGGREVSEC